MIRQYYAQRARGGDNPLRVGTVAAGSLFYLQDDRFFRDRSGGTPVCRTPWQVLGFLNGMASAVRRNRDSGCWEDAYCSGRSDMALVRSLRDARLVREVTVRLLVLHDDLGLVKQPTSYPDLPDVRRFRPARFAPAAVPAEPTPRLRQAA